MSWNALLPAFALIFVAELGDKTQLAVLTQTCKYGRPWPVFLGASLALTGVTLIGALGGALLTRWIPASLLQTIAAVAFIVMGLLVAREAWQRVSEDACPTIDCVTEGGWDWRAFGATFGLLFVAEMGDKTQLAVLTLATQEAAPWAVFAGGALALTAVTGLAVVGGRALCRVIPERTLLGLSAVAFVLIGLLMLLGWL